MVDSDEEPPPAAEAETTVDSDEEPPPPPAVPARVRNGPPEDDTHFFFLCDPMNERTKKISLTDYAVGTSFLYHLKQLQLLIDELPPTFNLRDRNCDIEPISALVIHMKYLFGGRNIPEEWRQFVYEQYHRDHVARRYDFEDDAPLDLLPQVVDRFIAEDPENRSILRCANRFFS